MKELMLILHFIGLALALGNGFAHMFLGIASSKLSDEESTAFRLKTLAINMMGRIGLFLLVLSGGYLMTPYWDSLMMNHLLLTKLALVVVLIVLVLMQNGLARKALKENGGPALAKMEGRGKIILPLAIIIVVLAVLVFG